MTTTTDLDVHDMVRQLTERHWHREPYPPALKGEREGHYGSDVTALVMQLVATTPYVTKADVGAATQATSRPTARIEALDTVMLIDDEAGEWIDRLGGTIPADQIDPRTCRTIVGSGTVLRLRRLHGLHPSTETCGRDDLVAHLHTAAEACSVSEESPHRKGDDGWCCQRGRLQHDVRRWWYQARIIAGWDMAAWIPNNTCPVCDERRKLRIRLDSALCVECRTVWSADQLGLLAEHIRTENRDEALPA